MNECVGVGRTKKAVRDTESNTNTEDGAAETDGMDRADILDEHAHHRILMESTTATTPNGNRWRLNNRRAKGILTTHTNIAPIRTSGGYTAISKHIQCILLGVGQAKAVQGRSERGREGTWMSRTARR
jgi:hypothetical protein